MPWMCQIPGNWPRVIALSERMGWGDETLAGVALSETDTRDAMKQLLALGYQSEPHGAIAGAALAQSLAADEKGLFLGTAHPAKFKDVVDRELQVELPLPQALAVVAGKPVLSVRLQADFALLKEFLFARLG